MNFKNYTIVGMALFAAIPFASAATELPEVFRILPEPQQVEVTSLSGIKGDDLKWITVTEGDEMPVLGAYLDALPRYKADGKGVMLVKTDKDVPESEEGYVLEIRKDGAVISSRGDAGLFYGCATLEQLITDSRESGTAIPKMTITDWPAIPYRAIHIDNKNHLDRVEYYYELIDKLASYKINGIIWEIEDKLQYSRRPEVAAPNAISKQEMQAISRYAKERHIEISPLIQGLGHATYILKHHWELREDPKNDGDFCPSNPETYEVLFSMYRDAMEAMPYGRFLHVGGDEVSNIGTDERCKATGKKPFDLQLEWLNKVCDFAVENGRTPIFWDDMPFKFAGLWYPINFNLPEEETRRLMDFTMVDEVIDRFPKECVYMRWFYGDATELGNVLTMDWYRKSGLKVMAATAASEGTCVMITRQDSRIGFIKGFSTIAAERGFVGIFATAWDDTSVHYKAVERGFIAQGEYGWNPTGRDIEEYKAAHARREFGLELADMEFIDEMEKIAPFYDDALITEGHRNPGFAVGEFKLIDLPDPAQPGKWSEIYAGRIDTARLCTVSYETACKQIDYAMSHSLRNRYTLEIYDVTNDLLYFPAKLILALEKYDKAPAGEKAAAVAELEAVCDYFYEMKAEVLDTYSETRFMCNGEGYVEGNSHHMHLASRTNNGDWVFWFELPMVRAIEKWIETAK